MAMDAVFRVHEQEFISDVVDFGSFLRDAVRERDRAFGLVGECGLRKANLSAEHFASLADIPLQCARDIFDGIDIGKLKSTHVHYNFDVVEPTETKVVQSSWHKTLGFLKKEHQKKKNPQYKSVANRLLKYDRVETSLLIVPKFDHMTDCEGTECNKLFSCKGEMESVDQEMNDEIIVTCSIYIGYSRPLHYAERRLGRLMKITDKVQVLGSSTLLDLKNSFECPSDNSFTQDMSDTPPHPSFLSKFLYPNSYFFIHDTFYVDDSVQNFQDLSAGVRQWAQNKEHIGEMKVSSMRQTRLIDMKARLGMPYLYVHQGQCEHLLCFTDLRLWESRDSPHASYPTKLQERNFRRVCCIGCKMNTAEFVTVAKHCSVMEKWVLIDADRLPFTPAFVCNGCYNEFNFTKESRKIGDFKAVPYCDRKALDRDGQLFMAKLHAMCASDPPSVMSAAERLRRPQKSAVRKPRARDVHSVRNDCELTELQRP